MSYQLFRLHLHPNLQNKNYCFSLKILKKRNSHFNVLEISVNGHKQTNKIIIANTFNRYFIKLGPSLANKLAKPSKSFKCWMKSAFLRGFLLEKGSPLKDLECTHNLDCSKATGFIPPSGFIYTKRNVVSYLHKDTTLLQQLQ